ncbi:MAG TPA: tetratricopeptide repeat protein [Longimicrobiales bacterium]|nr:tetratricopeptide repeat protein [Longimicrobiales bacterium]
MRLPIVLSVAALTLVACRPDDQRTETIDPRAQETRGEMAAEAVVQLDSGNVAYRADDFEAALRHYRRVVELEPEQASGWFGLAMANSSLGNAAAADSAFQRAQELAPGASLVHPTPEDTLP